MVPTIPLIFILSLGLGIGFAYSARLQLRAGVSRWGREWIGVASFGAIILWPALLYFHFHPFPPGFERQNPQVFNRLGVAMESLDDSPVGALMASAFVGAFVKE